MPISILGSIGLGLAWGWLVGQRDQAGSWQVLKGLAVGVATSLIGVEVFLLADWRALMSFVGASALAFVLHRQWRRELRQRYGPPPS
jgi:hypothetical protein